MNENELAIALLSLFERLVVAQERMADAMTDEDSTQPDMFFPLDKDDE